MNAARVSFNITNLSFSVSAILKGISCVSGVTLRGPFAKPDLLITSWSQFLKVYGGYISNSDFPLLCKRAFDRGSQLRVNRQGHYTDITDATTLDAVKASEIPFRKLLFSAGLVASNVFDMTINGVALTSTTYATSSDATMAAILVKIKAHASVQDAFFLESSTYRTIIILPKTTALTITAMAVTLGASQATITNTAVSTVIDASNNAIFSMVPKYHGADYNKLSLIISAPSNGQTGYFNLAIVHSSDSSLNESYTNLKITGNPNVTDSHYLDDVKLASQLLDFTYSDLSSTSGQITPRNGTYYFMSGSDGTAPADADYVGDSAGKNGFYAFDTVSDALQVAVPEISTNTVNLGGSAYTDNRKDMIFFAHLSNALTTRASLVTARQTTAVDSIYTAFFAGGLIISDPVTGIAKNISEIGDVLGISAFNDNIAPWFSMAGTNRGLIPNCLGIVNNFGGAANYAELTLLASAQINMVVAQDNLIYLNGNYSAALSNSKLSFLNAVRFLVWLQKTISPTIKRYLEEPGDIPSFKALYLEVKPFFDELVTGRAIQPNGWRWLGDQGAKDLTTLTVNNPTDLDNGKYKVKLFLKLVGTLHEIAIDINVTATSVSFEPAN